ncbi:hypothetical protein BJ875DRAFT_37353 [Amylocarpus encephaloides]|uniref:Uncharacterized protein n=1 Tax=Amylocarpus encephaloides TaxID=45428 RepID=A0A9P8C4L7_9HELO|nr:hypothetical protein BJ875DRAFT_37353 [Amylocarpus encephaloides]
MFYQQPNGSTTLPRDFRYHYDEPRTPEPLTAYDEPRQPSPPRQQRLRVKRRVTSNLNLRAPTEQFLASVAAADIPVPTVELQTEDHEMTDHPIPMSDSSAFLQAPPHLSTFGRGASPPRTPVPTLTMDEICAKRPNWSMRDSSDNFPRPTSSTASECSEDSFYSGSRRSRFSYDGSCTSPDSEIDDPFQFPPISKGKAKLARYLAPRVSPTLNQDLKTKTRKDAPWSKAMSEHLWSTYMVYLQDPTVTPFRMGASAIPPEGVCHRVAREARRSWKGPQDPNIQSSRLGPRRSKRLGGLTLNLVSHDTAAPPEEGPKVYLQWPHSSGATRNHLRELCRNKNSTAIRGHHHFQSRSPTPFTKPSSERLRFRTPEPHNSVFNTKDITLSLATSISETMQPNGPLASLATDDLDPLPTPDFTPSLTSLEPTKPVDRLPLALAIDMEEANHSRKLGSPFARTYGPSSSQLTRRPSPPRNNSATTAPRLRSPLHFDTSRSLNNTQKRRAQHALDDELSPNGAVLRPSILDQQLFGTPLGHSRRVRSRGFSLGNELKSSAPTFDLASRLGLQTRTATPEVTPPTVPTLLPAPTFDVPRLSSPFLESSPSQTFPRRIIQDGEATIRRGAFATMHQSRHSIESFDFGSGPSLQSRLERLDVKLKEIRDREASARR